MKTAISLIVSYILCSIVGTILCGFIFMVCDGLRFFVAGQELDVISLELFIHGIYFSAPGVFVLTQMLLILSVLRRKTDNKRRNHLFAIVTYLLLGILTWCLVFPKLIESASEFDEYKEDRLELVPLSVGYFRETDDGITYYTKISKEKKAEGLTIDVNGKYGKTGKIFPFYEKDISGVNYIPYSDILIKKAVAMPLAVSYPNEIYTKILDTAKNSWSDGKFAWLSFATLGLALLSLYSVQFLSSWKMVNAFAVILGGISICYINFLYYAEKFPSSVLNLPNRLPSLFSLENSVIVYINIIIFILLGIFGLVMGTYRIVKIGGNNLDSSKESL